MPSLKTSTVVLATAISIFYSAQAQSIDPNSVPLATRTSWCTTQKLTCPALCQQQAGSSTTQANTCNPATLTFSCICGNNISPNASEYSETLPYFICTEFDSQCVANCGGLNTCQAACVDDNPCGAQNPTRVNTTTSSSMVSTTTLPAGASSGTAGVVYTGLGGGPAATATASGKKSGSQAALDLGRSYGFAVVFTGIFAGFALIM